VSVLAVVVVVVVVVGAFAGSNRTGRVAVRSVVMVFV
jgi:hypothetical protein